MEKALDRRQMKRNPRRKFLHLIGLAGISGMAGCLGDDDDEIDDSDDAAAVDDADDTDDADDDPDPVEFTVSELAPTDHTLESGEPITVSARITNTESGEGAQEVTYQIDDTVLESVGVELAGFEDEEVTFEEVATEDIAPGEHTHGVYSDDDEATGTLTIEKGPDPGEDPDPLLTFTDSSVYVGEDTLGGTLQHNYDFTVEDVSVSLEVPDDWEINDETGTSVDELGPFATEEIEWELTIPDGDDDTAEVTADVSYRAGKHEVEVTVTHELNIIDPGVVGDPPAHHYYPVDEGDGDSVADWVSGADLSVGELTWVADDGATGGYYLESNGIDGSVLVAEDLDWLPLQGLSVHMVVRIHELYDEEGGSDTFVFRFGDNSSSTSGNNLTIEARFDDSYLDEFRWTIESRDRIDDHDMNEFVGTDEWIAIGLRWPGSVGDWDAGDDVELILNGEVVPPGSTSIDQLEETQDIGDVLAIGGAANGQASADMDIDEIRIGLNEYWDLADFEDLWNDHPRNS